MAIFDAREVFKMALRIEKNGEEFYRTAARIVEHSTTRETLNALAEAEVKHRRTFETLLSQASDRLESSAASEEYLQFLDSYAAGAIFTKSRMKKEIAKLDGLTSVLDFAMRGELDAISFFHEAKALTLPSEQELIEGILSEEREHYRRLRKLKGR